MGYYVNRRLENYASKLSSEGMRAIYIEVPGRIVKRPACPNCSTLADDCTCYGEFGYYQRTVIASCNCGTRFVYGG